MPGEPARKKLGRRAFIAAAGATAAYVAAEQASDAGSNEDLALGVVERVDGKTVSVRIEGSDRIVNVPMQDFPAHWVPQVGDRVTVGNDDSSGAQVALPLVAGDVKIRPRLEGSFATFGVIKAEVRNDALRADVQDMITNPKLDRAYFAKNMNQPDLVLLAFQSA